MVHVILVLVEIQRSDNMVNELIKQVDPNKKEYYITDVSIITLDDNLQHNYFSAARWSKYNQDPMAEAMIIMPFIDDIAQYWKKYSGTVIVSGVLSSQSVNTNSADFFLNTIQEQHKKAIEKNKILQQKNYDVTPVEDGLEQENKKDNKELTQRLINENYNYSYIGKVSRFKQKGQKFIIYLEDLGWKFSQKVPKEFRDTFVANQSLDDAFQAICEFMGIEFAYSIEDLNEYNFASDGYSIQKDGQTIEDVPSILKEWSDNGEEEEVPDDSEDYQTDENDEQNHNKNTTKNKNKKKKKNKTSKSSNNNDSSLASASVNQTFKPTNGTRNMTTGDLEENNSTAENDKTEDDTASLEEKIEKYQEEFDEKIKDLFIGNTYYDSNISDPILNYDWITITPKAPQTNTNDTTNNNITPTNDNSNSNNSNNNNNTNQNQTNI